MKTLQTGALMSAFFMANAISIFAQGNIVPTTAPNVPIMKSLDQIEPRTPISSLPFTISLSGSYYLTKNLNVTSGDAITITSSGVTLDLNGFNITSTASPAAGTGILIASGLIDIAIFNGHIRGAITYGGGIYSGSGFGSGIFYSGTKPSNVRVIGVSVSGVMVHGIYLADFNSTVVQGCTVNTAGSNGITAASVSESSADNCGLYGMVANNANNCFGGANGSGYGLAVNNASNCTGRSSGSGHGLDAQTATGCYGNGPAGDGLFADSAENSEGGSVDGIGLNARTASGCYGTSASNVGLNAGPAVNCYGVSISGTGLRSYATATGCYGTSSNHYGIDAQVATNCYGDNSGSGVYGLSAAHVASNCYGRDHGNGTGLYSFVANNCMGESSGNGYGIEASIATNCLGASGSGGHGVRFIDIGAMCYGFTTGVGFSYVLGNGAAGPINLP